MLYHALETDKGVQVFVKDLHRESNEILKLSQQAGLKTSKFETDFLNYLPHILTPEARKYLRGGGVKGLARKILNIFDRHTIRRTLLTPTDPQDINLMTKLPKMRWKEKKKLLLEGKLRYPAIAEINEQAMRGVLIPDANISQFFYEDPAKIMAIRKMRSEKAILSTRIMENARDVGLKEGFAVPYEKGAQIPQGYDVVKSPLTKDVLFEQDVADILNKTYDTFASTDKMNPFMKAYMKTYGWWKLWTLMPFPSYHFRNVFGGNLFNQMLAGMNPIKEGWWNPRGANSISARIQRVHLWKNRGKPKIWMDKK